MNHSTSGNAWLIHSLSLMMLAAGAAAGIVGLFLWLNGRPGPSILDRGIPTYHTAGVGLMCLAVLLSASGAAGFFVAKSALKLDQATVLG